MTEYSQKLHKLFILVDCGVPGRPTNGQVSFGSTVEGSVANYGCDFGYDLVGASQRRCTSGDNLWSGNVPECRSEINFISVIVCVCVILSFSCGLWFSWKTSKWSV